MGTASIVTVLTLTLVSTTLSLNYDQPTLGRQNLLVHNSQPINRINSVTTTRLTPVAITDTTFGTSRLTPLATTGNTLLTNRGFSRFNNANRGIVTTGLRQNNLINNRFVNTGIGHNHLGQQRIVTTNLRQGSLSPLLRTHNVVSGNVLGTQTTRRFNNLANARLVGTNSITSLSSNLEDPNLVSFRSDNDGLGGYDFAYQTVDGTSRQETGGINAIGANSVQGSYSYISPEGVEVVVNYVADENGFQVDSPNVPAIPEHSRQQILRAEEARLRGIDLTNAPNSVGSLSNIQTLNTGSNLGSALNRNIINTVTTTGNTRLVGSNRFGNTLNTGNTISTIGNARIIGNNRFGNTLNTRLVGGNTVSTIGNTGVVGINRVRNIGTTGNTLVGNTGLTRLVGLNNNVGVIGTNTGTTRLLGVNSIANTGNTRHYHSGNNLQGTTTTRLIGSNNAIDVVDLDNIDVIDVNDNFDDVASLRTSNGIITNNLGTSNVLLGRQQRLTNLASPHHLGIRSGSTFAQTPFTNIRRPLRLRSARQSVKEEDKVDEIIHKTKLEDASGNAASHVFKE